MTILRAVQDLNFTVVVTLAIRYFALRDRLLRKTAQAVGGNFSLRHTIQSGRNRLDAVFVAPTSGVPRAAILICHGIGETVESWHRVQGMLAEQGVASLVFDYSGYGRSSGFIRTEQCENDAIAAFHYLEGLQPQTPISILGFSLGSGIAVSILNRISAKHLVLCAAYTSIRAAAFRVGIPRSFGFIVPPIWEIVDSLRGCSVPVLIVHGARDRLFPMKMAEDLASSCGTNGRLFMVPGVGHDDPYYRPERAYWQTVADFLH